ncbi:efflux RND transporter periplasmic adaptor subunit [Thiomicrospira microaerophila]|uniref:efflux RND transporter periplasmic adaptor subunit n=1 Tax=Thiomicrospira microaerophila TaxID=406020 RepID=UPI00200F487E|nr:efflux RND transporter periplasmic adaptor subunit [Thiomicrospira microaerophila]UQB42501.1 efflux RND transporter periplasmic adaptor subunit [Thiomicrospira microaerophila]
MKQKGILPALVLSLILTSPMNWASDNWRNQVVIQPLAEVVIELSQSFAAEVISPNQTALSSEINARIKHIQPRPGEFVKSGQRLIELDCGDQQLQLERLQAQQQQTQASLSLAQLQVTRFESLQARDLSSRSQLDEAQTQVQQLQAQQQLLNTEQRIAQRQIQRCQIYAPFDGVVLQQNVGLGQWVSIGTPLLDLLQTKAAEIETQVPFSWLHNAQSTSRPADLYAIFRAQGIEEQQVKLLRQAPNIEPRGRSVKLWFSAETELPIGLSGQITLTQSRPYLPASIIVQRDQDLGVFVVDGEQLQFRILDQAQEGRPYLLPADWPTDLQIVTQGQQRLKRE